APDLTHAEYTFKNDAGKEFALRLATSSSGERVQWLDAARQTPLYRQRENEPLWFTISMRSKRFISTSRVIQNEKSSKSSRRGFLISSITVPSNVSSSTCVRTVAGILREVDNTSSLNLRSVPI